MKLSLDLKTTLSQTLTPQQIQYLKLLQMPVMQLEQYLQQEIEQNPMLEDLNNADLDVFEYDDDVSAAVDTTGDLTPEVFKSDDYSEGNEADFYNEKEDFSDSFDIGYKQDYNDDPDPFDLYSMVWQDSSEVGAFNNDDFGNDDEPHFQIKSHTSLEEDLIEQLSMLNLSEEDLIIGTMIIGNIDDDGYLRRPLMEITDDVNSQIAEVNFQKQREEYIKRQEIKEKVDSNPASRYSLSEESMMLLERAKSIQNGTVEKNDFHNNLNFNTQTLKILHPVTIDRTEKVLQIVQKLDPPGIASRDLRECLLLQCKAFIEPSYPQSLALRILENAYEPFIRKHYQVIAKQLSITEEEIKAAIDVIKRLNPKPGGGDSQAELNSVIPDFIVERDEESDELMISLNDSRLPNLKLSKAYESLQKDAKLRQFNKETKNWIRGKREDAKFMIQAIKQRKNTMLKVMTSIATLQKDFFYEGKSGIKPLIYKVVAEQTGLDISTVCRIVNGKYVQTEFGTYELKFFFSEALISDDGEDVSTTVIKEKIKEIIDSEPKNKPSSDDQISKILKENGYNVARRTVAKYREQMRIPVARLRVEI